LRSGRPQLFVYVCVKFASIDLFTYNAGMATNPSKEAIALAYRIGLGSYALQAALRRHAQDVLAEVDLPVALADAVCQLDPDVGPLPRGALAERLNCDPSNVTFIADRLEERGLVKRAVSGTDRRVKALVLTPAGVKVRKKVIASFADAPALRRLTAAEKRQLADLLERSTADETGFRHADVAAERA
jgi:DNA-binding MarR family transcriptional regulator